MNELVKPGVFANDFSRTPCEQHVVISRSPRQSKVNVEIGNGAIAPKVALKRAKGQAPVNVEIGNGAIAPKVALKRAKASKR